MEEVKTVIAGIRSKVANLKSDLQSVQTENIQLKEKLTLLESRLEEREAEVVDFKAKVDQLTQQNVMETSSFSHEPEDQNEQIDALVREIDDCIGRLKQ